MERHHEESIENMSRELEPDQSLLALILGGSLAHGFARPDSDIDVTMVVSGEELRRRRRENRLHYVNRALCTYEGGYVDGKYVDLAFLEAAAERGSDPARFAFQGNRILFSRVDGLAELLARIVRFPVGEKEERVRRFAAQLLAWRWYYGEGAKQGSRYLTTLAASKLALFAGRIILTVNELLYPYHKWFLRVLEGAPRRPERFMDSIRGLLEAPSREKVEPLVRSVFAFAGVDFAAVDAVWPTRFMKDSEQKWLDGAPSIDDI
jgi:predicted nucleotidyltransferase